MGEQRFKVGDWVRSLVNWGDIEVGKVYQVPHLDGDGEPWFTPDGTGGWSDYLTLDEIEPWQPRVGERVKVTGNDQWAGDGEVTKLRNYGVFVVLMKTGRFAGKTGGFYIRDIEPIISTTTPEQPATLKIEAGKFYKTRDGRKVGPAFIVGSCAVFGNGSNYASAVWAEDGRSSHRDDKLSLKDNDIIAEWIDEPVVANAKASNDNAKPKFKVGDRVEITANDNYRVNFVGSFGTIKTAPTNAAAGFRVELDDGREFPFWPSEMTVRPSSALPTTTIVALIENGQPKPSSTPHVHTSADAAEKEAKRLAAKYKGKQFGVFTLTATHHEPKPIYDHKWQNMAALGLKIDAIKELRAVAGLTLKGAKDAVEAWIEYEQAA
ncbi:hypothetical protein [Agrobacterium tumefaciens]|uniref:hypothetical protein n=1 Tax=Agrobacterium tumefaciens TaxID=358 RepID=UPI00277FD339|nr:hypothetical protein [Agrobacterium tumefaciens]MDP9854543.1 hypothetical protein [Agrobacterium tumefaciens]